MKWFYLQLYIPVFVQCEFKSSPPSKCSCGLRSVRINQEWMLLSKVIGLSPRNFRVGSCFLLDTEESVIFWITLWPRIVFKGSSFLRWQEGLPFAITWKSCVHDKCRMNRSVWSLYSYSCQCKYAIMLSVMPSTRIDVKI